jgi:hypothetical protein
MSAPTVLEQGLRLLVVEAPTIVAVTGEAGVYLNAVPENSPDPCILISKISSTPDATMDGPSGFNIRRYQFTFFSKDYPTAIKLQEITRLVIDGFHGALPTTGQIVYNIIRDNEVDGFDNETGWHHSITDYFIHFAE